MRPGTRTARLAAPAVALALLVTACDTGDEPAPIRVDHATAPAPATAQAAVDPAAGVMTRTWRTDLEGTFDLVLTKFAFTPGQLLTVSRRGVDAVATRDGRSRWHYYEHDRSVTGYALTAGTLVLLTQGKKTHDPRTVALDAATGRELWRSTTYEPENNGVDLVEASGHGVVALSDTENSSMLVGVDARTGERRWEWPGFKTGGDGFASCRYYPFDSDGDLLLVHTVCFEDDARIVALDPGTGKPRWQRPTSRPAWATSRAGLTLVPEEKGDSTDVVLIGKDGRELKRFPTGSKTGPGAGSLVVTAGRAVLWYGSRGGSEGRLASVDPRTGATRTSVKARIMGELAVGSGRVYAQRNHLEDEKDVFHAATPLPGGLETVDPATLDIGRVPLPSPAVSGFWQPGREPSGTSRVLSRDGRAYVAQIVPDGLRLTGYAPGGPPASPPELGGVPARDWPDACELGRGLKDAYPPSGKPPLLMGTARIAGWSCDFALKEGGGYDVWTAWVARDAAEADRLLDPAESTERRARSLNGIGDEAYSLPSLMGNSFIALRVGRYIAVVEATQHKEPRTIAEVVARNLRRLS